VAEESDTVDAGDPWAALLDAISGTLASLLSARGVPVEAAAVNEQLAMPSEGPADVAFATHRAAKSLGIPPAQLAAEVAAAFPKIPGVVAVSASGAYVNAQTDAVALARSTLDLVFTRRARYGNAASRSDAVCVEHTSANPTGPFHIGRVRNGIIGDTLARVLRAAGYPVTTQYYVDDVGRQAAMITWIWSMPEDRWPAEIRSAVAALPPTSSDRPDLHYGRPYPAVSAYLKDHADAREEIADLSRRLEQGEAIPRHHELAEAILGGMILSLQRIGIRFDEFVWESRFLKDGSVGRVIERLRAAPHAVQEENGAWAIDTESYGLPKERARVIVTRSDGTSLYPTRDVAYHLEKLARFRRVIDVLGQDHYLHARSLEALLVEAGEVRRPEFVIYQDITVPEGGRMSTRKGSAVYLDDLLDEAEERARAEVKSRREDLSEEDTAAIARSVAAGAVRYHILRVAPEKTVGFRWEDALSFEGRSGPFLQYSFARASSLLRKAGMDPAAPYPFRAEDLATPEERRVVHVLSRYPRTIAYVARTAHVHTLAGYAHELAEAFNSFYQKVPVLTASTGLRESRLALVAAARQTLANALGLLGLDPLERM
jgi:arginyl-tRNA synthetase